MHHLHAQASLIAEDLLKSNPDVVRVIFNKFRSAISFKPTIATVLLPEVRTCAPTNSITVWFHDCWVGRRSWRSAACWEQLEEAVGSLLEEQQPMVQPCAAAQGAATRTAARA